LELSHVTAYSTIGAARQHRVLLIGDLSAGT
jgi:hypothetical protein